MNPFIKDLIMIAFAFVLAVLILASFKGFDDINYVNVLVGAIFARLVVAVIELVAARES